MLCKPHSLCLDIMTALPPGEKPGPGTAPGLPEAPRRVPLPTPGLAWLPLLMSRLGPEITGAGQAPPAWWFSLQDNQSLPQPGPGVSPKAVPLQGNVGGVGKTWFPALALSGG